MPLLPTPGYFVGVPTYLYGPVPSPGVPSTLYVDLFNNQTVAGDKTFTNTLYVNKATGSGNDLLQKWTMDDDPIGFLSLENGTVVAARFIPLISAQSPAVPGLAGLVVRTNVLEASGANAIIDFRSTALGAAPATRRMFTFRRGGDLAISGDATGNLLIEIAGQGLRVKEGSNAKQGVATLVSGTVTVANTSVTADSRILLTGQDNNATGALRVSARTPGVSFTITSSDVAATGVVAYEIFEPA